MFRKWFVIYTICVNALSVAAFIFIQIMSGDFYTQTVGNIIGAAIWITYVYKSKRVKNTFIYPYLNVDTYNANHAIISENVENYVEPQ